MKETGIVRRIDELGRIVIPKEMRKILRIQTGTPLEIRTTKEGEIILTKYSVIEELKDYAELVAKALFESLNMHVAICDTDSIISVAGLSKKTYISSPIHTLMEQAMRYGKAIILNKNDGANMIPFTNEEFLYIGEIIVPVIKDGDIVGAIIVLSEQDVTLNDVKVVSSMANYLRFILEA